MWRKLGDVGEYPPHTTAGAGYPTSQPLRPQSAAGNPLVSSGSSGPARSQPPSHSMPSSPTTPDYYDSRGNLRQAATAPGSLGDVPGQGNLGQVSQSGGYTGERRGQLPQGARSSAGHSGQGQGGQSTAHSPGEMGNYGHGGRGMGNYGQGGGGKENLPGQGGGGRENSHGQKGNRAKQGATYSQLVVAPSAHSAERPRHQQPPPYSSAKTSSTVTPSSRPGSNPSQYPPPPSHQIPQPHHQPPLSRQSQQPLTRYQQRTHPLHANQGLSPPSQGHPIPRSASSSATYYVSHPTSQSKSHSASALPSHTHPNPASSIPGASYLYSQRGGTGAQHPQFRPNQGGGEQTSRSGADSGRTEWRQTYLDD